MTRKITIEVQLSDDVGNTGITGYHDGHWQIVVFKEKGVPNDPATFLAHELGHVLANEFQLPKAMRDIRRARIGLNFVEPPDIGRSIYDAEVEAWDVAERILRLDRFREMFLKTYEKKFLNQRSQYEASTEVQDVR